jgi:hypothetical protein
MYSQSQFTAGRIAEIDSIRKADREFFNQHPEREFLLRRARSAEYSGTPSRLEMIYVIMHRDDVENYWDHDFFKESINFDPTPVTDAQLRGIVAEIRKRSQ